MALASESRLICSSLNSQPAAPERSRGSRTSSLCPAAVPPASPDKRKSASLSEANGEHRDRQADHEIHPRDPKREGARPTSRAVSRVSGWRLGSNRTGRRHSGRCGRARRSRGRGKERSPTRTGARGLLLPRAERDAAQGSSWRGIRRVRFEPDRLLRRSLHDELPHLEQSTSSFGEYMPMATNPPKVRK
jgi:hypothetical protein